MTILSTLLSYLTANPSPLRLPQTSLHLSQQAPIFLASPESSKDTQETWLVYEQLLLSCLRTGDDTSARLCLQRLSDRFGADSPRISALAGLYDEATAQDRGELEKVCSRYEDMLKEDPTNMPIEKRHISLLTHLSRTEDAIKALTALLNHSPNDAESWSQLSALYFQQSLYAQSIFCLEEVLLILPNAYNIFARLGEVNYVASEKKMEGLVESMKHLARSVELCEWYLRGWYGLKLVTGKILEQKGSERAGVERRKVEGLNEMATKKLTEIVTKARRRDNGWEGFDEAEVEAARLLIDASDAKTVR
ncbi:Inositol phosphatase SIW14 [Maublancomyces gigas]|uniref:ER membrane protein complex subunit 2 n=1 Tax=Discina gigas TaxID=1032678 RepID=A0ABR3GAI2_9PEZI